MLRALALASLLALTAGAALAQPGDANDGRTSNQPVVGQPGYQPHAAWGPGMAGHIPVDPQTRALRRAQRSACAADMASYCASVDPSDHRAVHQCMKTNETKFAPACQSAISDLHAYRRQLRSQDGASLAAPTPQGASPE